MNNLIDRFSLESYRYQGNIVASYASFPLSIIIQEGDFKKGEIYLKENLYGGIGKIFHDFKNGAPVVLFQMLTENPSTGHDCGIYLEPLVVNTTILHCQKPFNYQKNDSTGFISNLHVLTNKPCCINGELDDDPLIKEFNLRLQKKIEFLKTKT